MKDKKAIKIIQGQINKIDNLNENNLNSWKTQTKTFLKTFFNDNEYLDKIKYFTLKDINARPVGEQCKSEKELKGEMKTFLTDCKQTIESVGVYKPPVNNFFSNFNNWKILGILFACLVFGFGIGKWVRSQEISNSNKNKSATISTSNETNNIRYITENKNETDDGNQRRILNHNT